MNIKAISFMKNFSYTFSSNLVTLFVSTLIVLVVPKLIGITEYGYLQLYIFLSTYVGFLHFGWNDGIYLRYGGVEYSQLDKRLFYSQFWMLFFSQIVIAILVIITTSVLINNIDKIFIYRMVALALILVNTKFMLLYILQATNKIKDFSKIAILEKVLYVLVVTVILMFSFKDYKLVIISDLIAKFISLIYAMICLKDIIFRKISDFYYSLSETIENINVGIKLMIANLASMLIIGSVRFGIENSWDVATFGKVSLALSISNFMMIFINALGLIMFPILRRTDKKNLPDIYITLRDFILFFLLGMLITYYPLKVGLTIWLPQYTDSFMYMAIVFPIFVYEGKMAILVNTYLKTLRKEKLMLKINLISLAISLLITIIVTQLFVNLDLAILSIVFLLVLRSIMAEIYLSKVLRILVYKDIILEFLVTSVFIIVGWCFDSWITVIIYILAYLIYLLIKRKDITNSFESILTMIKSKSD
ncbi:MATE family efflux transporter [Paenibacillus puerhi]|uniref:hypothetical protein n=1 Tax=Paenibacillus puerhi TaxID=2692622 RepID=UPI001357ADBB|nr:hypothetical protein [Paenibacillus puerhi]